jgi:hypothetical protein
MSVFFSPARTPFDPDRLERNDPFSGRLAVLPNTKSRMVDLSCISAGDPAPALDTSLRVLIATSWANLELQTGADCRSPVRHQWPTGRAGGGCRALRHRTQWRWRIPTVSGPRPRSTTVDLDAPCILGRSRLQQRLQLFLSSIPSKSARAAAMARISSCSSRTSWCVRGQAWIEGRRTDPYQPPGVRTCARHTVERGRQVDRSAKKGGLFEGLWGAVISNWLPTETTTIEIGWSESPFLRVGSFGQAMLTPLEEDRKADPGWGVPRPNAHLSLLAWTRPAARVAGGLIRSCASGKEIR